MNNRFSRIRFLPFFRLLLIGVTLSFSMLIVCCSRNHESERTETVVLPARLPELDEDGPFLLSGDLNGSSSKEAVVGSPDGAYVYDTDGTPAGNLTFDTNRWKMLCLADWDDDGKMDLVLSGRNSPGMVLRVVNGSDRVIAETPQLDSTEAVIQTATVGTDRNGGILAFTAYPQDGRAPRIVGTMRIGGSLPEITLTTVGPIPDGLFVADYIGDQVILAIANRAGRMGVNGYSPEAAPQPDKPWLHIPGFFEEPIGPPVRHAYIGEGQVSHVSSIPVDIDDDRIPEALVLIEHLSASYTGNSRLELRDRSGRVLRTLEGPPETSGLIVPVIVDGMRRYLVGWSAVGELSLLDENLNVLAQSTLPGTVHDVQFTMPADTESPFLVTSAATAYLLDADLTVVSTVETPSIIRDALLVGEGGGRNLFLLGDQLRLFSGVDVGSHRTASAGDPPVAEELTVSPSEGTGPLPTVLSIPAGYRVKNWDDYDGNGVLDAFFLHEDGRRYRIISIEGRNIVDGVLPRLFYTVGYPGDLNNDGLPDLIGTFSDRGRYGVMAVSFGMSRRQILYLQYLTYGYEWGLRYLSHADSLVLLRMATGYMKQPRGIFGIDADTGALRFFRPTAGNPFTCYFRPEGIYADYATPSNGVEVQQVEGYLDIDSHPYRHIIDYDGNPT